MEFLILHKFINFMKYLFITTIIQYKIKSILFILILLSFPLSKIAAQPPIINIKISNTLKKCEEYKQIKQTENLHNTINRLGELYFIKGDNNKAIEILLNNEKEIIKHLGYKNIALAKCYDILGEVYCYLLDVEEAYKYWNNSLVIKTKLYGDNSIYAAENYSYFGRYYTNKMDFEKAYNYETKALKICWNNKDSLYKINSPIIYKEYAYIVKVYFREINYPKAYSISRKYLDSALYLNKKYFSDNIYFAAQIYHDLGNTYTDDVLTFQNSKTLYLFKNKITDATVKANYFYQKAIDFNTKGIGFNNDKVSMTYYVKGILCSYSLDSLGKIIANFHKSLNVLIPEFKSKCIYDIPPFNDRVSNKSHIIAVLRFSACLFESEYNKNGNIKDLETAFKIYEVTCKYWELLINEYKTFEIYQMLQTWDLLPFNPAISIAHKLFKLTGDETYKTKAFTFSEKSKYSVLLKNVLQAKSTGTINHKKLMEVLSVKGLQGKLDNETAYIEYFYNSGSIYTFIISKNKFDFIEVPNDSNKLDEKIYSFRNAIITSNFNDYINSSNYLYNKLLIPVTPYLKKEIKKIVIVPHSNISMIPFDCLITNKNIPNKKDYKNLKFLIYKYNIYYTLSASLEYKQKNNNLNNHTVSGFAPDVSNSSDLPFSKESLKNISDKFNGCYFLSKKATKENFLNNIQNAGIIHLATHSKVETENSLNSSISFYGNNITPENLYLKDLYNLKLNADLAILSACETGLGKYEQGEGIINFARGFAFAGVPSTIITLWKVDDKTTSEIIESFYDYLLKGFPKAEALHYAKLDYLKNAKTSDDFNPFYWSGIVLIGNNDVVKLEAKSHNAYLYYISVGAIILLLGYYGKNVCRRL